MMSADEQQAITAFRLIAAQAQRLAEGIERGRFWPGEVSAGMRQINAALEDARAYADRDSRQH